MKLRVKQLYSSLYERLKPSYKKQIVVVWITGPSATVSYFLYFNSWLNTSNIYKQIYKQKTNTHIKPIYLQQKNTMTEENTTPTNPWQSKAITETIKTNPLKHAVAPGKKNLEEAIEMWDKLRNTAKDQISIGLDKFEQTLSKSRKQQIN